MGANALYLLLGFAAGIFGGVFGLGGGIIVVPALVFLFKFTQQQAQGTTLAMLVPPIGLLAAWFYYKQGYVNMKVAALMCIGFFLGGLLGAKFAAGFTNAMLERAFGVVMLVIALKMIFLK